MLKRIIFAGALIAGAIGFAGTAHADETRCDSEPLGTGIGIFIGGVTSPEPTCSAEVVPVDDPTGTPQTEHCTTYLVVIADCNP